MRAPLTILFSVFIAGCATMGVDNALKPFEPLTRMDEGYVAQKAYVFATSATENSTFAPAFPEMDASQKEKFVFVRWQDAFYIAPFQNEQSVAEKAIMLGRTPTEAATTAMYMIEKIRSQNEIAKKNLADGLNAAAAGMAAAQQQQYYSPPAQYAPIGGGSVVGLMPEQTEQLLDRTAPGGNAVHVNGYFRSNGTYVAPHYQSSPDSSFYNNWSTKGNVNPYTGKAGTRVSPAR